MIQLYSKEVGPEKQRRITNLVAAYPYLLRQHIRPGCLCSTDANIPAEHRLLLHEQRYLLHETRHEGQDDNRKGNAQLHELEPLTTECWVDKRALPWSLFLPQSLPAIAHAENRPLWVCDRMAALIAKIPYGPNFTSRERLVLLGMVDKLTNAVGQCERIHQTAVPLNYARHSLRSLTLWLFTLPFALVNDLGLFTAPANAAIAWLFFGVYQIGYSIEDPFQGSLRLSILCDAIRRSVIRQAFEMRDSAYQLDDCDERYEECSTAANEQHDSMSVPELKDAIRRSVMENVATVVAERDDGEIVQLLFDKQESLVPTTKQPSLHGKEVHQQEHLLTPDDDNTCVQPQLPEPILTDEALLKAPKLVRCMNGTWVEVGI